MTWCYDVLGRSVPNGNPPVRSDGDERHQSSESLALPTGFSKRRSSPTRSAISSSKRLISPRSKVIVSLLSSGPNFDPHIPGFANRSRFGYRSIFCFFISAFSRFPQYASQFAVPSAVSLSAFLCDIPLTMHVAPKLLRVDSVRVFIILLVAPRGFSFYP